MEITAVPIVRSLVLIPVNGLRSKATGHSTKNLIHTCTTALKARITNFVNRTKHLGNMTNILVPAANDICLHV